MRTHFLEYRENISVDFTFKLVKEKDSTGRCYIVELIVGSSLSKKIVPFALTLVV
jgi:hypothetical protein